MEGCFLAFQRSDLLLDSAIFRLLEIEMSFPKISFILHFLLYAYKFIRETFLDVSCLHGENRLKCIFFTPQDLYFLLVIIKLVRYIFDLLLDRLRGTYKVWSLPLREAGLEPKLLPVWSIKIILIFNKYNLSLQINILINIKINYPSIF